MKRIKYGLIGLGAVGTFCHLESIIKNKRCELVAVCDLKKEKLNHIKNKYGIKGYTSYQEMIKENKFDAIVLSSSLVTLYNISNYIIKKKINLLSEKPFCTSFKQSKNLCNLSKKYKTKHVVGFMKIYDPALIKLKKIIQNKKNISSIYYSSFGGKAFAQDFKSKKNKYSNTSGVNNKILKKVQFLEFLNTHSHAVSVLNYLFGKIDFIKKKNLKNNTYVNLKGNNKKIKLKYGKKFSLKWNEFLRVNLINCYIKLKFAPPNMPLKRSVLIMKYYNSKKFRKYNFAHKYTFDTQIKEFNEYIQYKKKKNLNSIGNVFNYFNIYENIFL